MSALNHRDCFAKDFVWSKGSSDGIKYVLFNMEEEDPASPMMILTRFEPGATVTPHTHASNYFEYMVSGEQTVGKVTFRAGDVRLVKGGTGYGPITVGPEGCTVLIVFQHGSGAAMEFLPRKRKTA
jgi:anti-sigma factor ChrR (cupin superfamily)